MNIIKLSKCDMNRSEEAAGYDFLPSSYILPGDYALFVEVNNFHDFDI